jgi:hypothetical protein
MVLLLPVENPGEDLPKPERRARSAGEFPQIADQFRNRLPGNLREVIAVTRRCFVNHPVPFERSAIVCLFAYHPQGMHLMRWILIFVLFVVFIAEATAGPRSRTRLNYQALTTPVYPSHSITETATTKSRVTVDDALAEVNAARAARGLPPFAHDEGLAQAARACANLRAQYLVAGHTANDFAALPAGTTASAAGCGALEPSWGWRSCCTFDNYRYAGAAVVMGRDGRRFMHLFVR